jgi:hypothetical protein
MLLIAGVAFGIKWGNPTFFYITGFVSLYLLLFSLIMIFYWKLTNMVQSICALLCILLTGLTVALTNNKMISNSSIPWLNILIPFLVVIALISWCVSRVIVKNLGTRTLLKEFFAHLVSSLIFGPPTLGLIFYCHSLDTTSSFHLSRAIRFLSLHLFIIFLYFLEIGGRCLENFFQNQNQRTFVNFLVILSSFIAMVVDPLIISQSIPSSKLSLLASHFNLIFYLLVIVECFQITRLWHSDDPLDEVSDGDLV